MRGRDWRDRRREVVSWREGEQFRQVEKEKGDEDEEKGSSDEPVKWHGGESGEILQDTPTITHLTYECMEGETPVAARRRAILSYLAQTMEVMGPQRREFMASCTAETLVWYYCPL
jgi:hypothetical protein